MRYIVIFILLLLPHGLSAQVRTIMLVGTVDITGGTSLPYELVLTDSSGMISGYALTDMEFTEKIKTAVTGTIDSRNHTIDFKETHLLNTFANKYKGGICLINGKLFFSGAGDDLVVTGSYTGYEIGSNHLCGIGSINMKGYTSIKNDPPAKKIDTSQVQKKEIHQSPAPVPKIPEVIIVKKTTPDVKTVIVAPKQTAAVSVKEITHGINADYEWQSNDVVIDIWDGGKVDGDIVTLFFNNKVILNNYRLQKEKKQVVIPLADDGVNVLSIVAGNEGSEPPNTVDIQLHDGDIHYEIKAYNSTGQRSEIKIKKAFQKH